MKIIQWNERISTNNFKIDNQHKKLIDIVNNLSELIKIDSNSKILNETLSELLKFSITHFKDEEELMRQTNYPELDQHIKKHKDFSLKIANFCSDVQNNKTNITEKLLEFLVNELMVHTNIDDQNYKNHI